MYNAFCETKNPSLLGVADRAGGLAVWRSGPGNPRRRAHQTPASLHTDPVSRLGERRVMGQRSPTTGKQDRQSTLTYHGPSTGNRRHTTHTEVMCRRRSPGLHNEDNKEEISCVLSVAAMTLNLKNSVLNPSGSWPPSKQLF